MFAGSPNTACSAIMALFYISTLIMQGWLLVLFFLLFCPSEKLVKGHLSSLKDFQESLNISPFCNSSVTLTSAADWAEIKQGLNVSGAGSTRQESNIKSSLCFHWSKSLIWFYIPPIFQGLFWGQNSLGLVYLLFERRPYIANNIPDPLKSTIIIYKDYILPESYICLTLLFHEKALLKHFLHSYCIWYPPRMSSKFAMPSMVPARFVECVGT